MLEHKINKNKFVDFCNGDVKGEDTETLNHFDEHTRYQFTRMLYAYGTGMTGQNPFANDEKVEITADIDSAKIDELPEDLRMKVDVMLADTSNTYEYISQFLKGEGYDISKSSVGRYATRTNNAMQRLLEAQAQTDRLIQVVKENPEADYTEAAILLTMNGLLNKVATAEEEFNEMPLDKAGRLIASLSRTKVYKDRVKQDMRRKADIAFREMESEMLKVIKQDEKSAAQLKEILAKAKERMMEDD